MKFDFLKKNLIKVAAICLVIMLLCGAVAYFVTDYNDSLAAQIDDIKSKTTGNDSQYTLTVKQVNDAKDALEFYSDYSSSDSSDPENFRRDYAKNLLGKLKDQLNLVDLKFSMDPFQKKTGDMAKKHVSFFTSKVTVQLTTNSDIDFYKFIQSIAQDFPGTISVDSYTITRKHDLLEEDMPKLKEDQLAAGNVDGEVIFQWGTILDNPETEKKDKAKPAAAPAPPAPPAAPAGVAQ